MGDAAFLSVFEALQRSRDPAAPMNEFGGTDGGDLHDGAAA